MCPTVWLYLGEIYRLQEDNPWPGLSMVAENMGVSLQAASRMIRRMVEEGDNTQADIFFAQDAGALGLLADENVLTPLPSYILDSVEPRFRSAEGLWVGITGRARVVTYNTAAITPSDLPDTLLGFTDTAWSGRVGFAPTNASFLSHLTAIRVAEGDDTARAFVQGLLDNDAMQYDKNSPAVAAVAAGEIDAALVNHYYMFRLLAENPDAPVANYYFPNNDIGNLINVAGAGVIATSDNKPLAQQFIAFLLSRSAQSYFIENTFEYPMLIGMEADPRLKPLNEIETPDLDLSNLDDLQGTLELLEELISD